MTHKRFILYIFAILLLIISCDNNKRPIKYLEFYKTKYERDYCFGNNRQTFIIPGDYYLIFYNNASNKSPEFQLGTQYYLSFKNKIFLELYPSLGCIGHGIFGYKYYGSCSNYKVKKIDWGNNFAEFIIESTSEKSICFNLKFIDMDKYLLMNNIRFDKK